MIDYALEEAALCGVEEVIVIVSPEKPQLLEHLRRWDGRGMRLTLVEQPEPKGTGDALWRARGSLGEAPFLWMMPDFLLTGGPPPFLQILLAIGEEEWDGAVGLVELEAEEAEAFGNVGLVRDGERLSEGLLLVRDLSPKEPGPLRVGATVLKAVGRWLLTPRVFPYLQEGGRGGEWDDTPALRALCREGRVLGVVLRGRAYDLGNRTGYQRANRAD